MREAVAVRAVPNARSAGIEEVLAALPDDNPEVVRRALAASDAAIIVEQAEAHAVSGALLDAVGRYELARHIPSPVLDRLRRTVVRQLLINERIEDWTHRIATALEEASVPAVVLKGPSLARRLYGDLAKRVSTDVDVLIAPEQTTRALSALRALGYDAPHPDRYARAFSRYHHHFQAMHRSGPVVELHFDLHNGFGSKVPSAPFVDRARLDPTSRNGRLWVLDATDELLYLALHAAGHRFEQLSWLYELKLYARSGASIDWPALWTTAERFGVVRAVRLSLAVAASRLGAPLPITAASAERVLPLSSAYGPDEGVGKIRASLWTAGLADSRADALRALSRKALHVMTRQFLPPP